MTRRVALLVLIFLLASACGRKSDTPAQSGSAKSPSPTENSADGSPAAPGEAKSPTSPSPVPSEVAKGAPLDREALKPTDPGRYSYNETGMRKLGGCGTDGPPPSPTSLTVDAADGNRQKNVRDRRFSSGQGEVTTSIFEFRKEGIYLVYLLQEQFTPLGKNSTEFKPAEAVLVFPTDPQVETWSFAMTSTDGKTSVEAHNVIESRDEAMATISGETVSSVRVKRTSRITGQSIAGEVNLREENTSWISNAARLITKQVTDTKGTVGTCQIETHVEAVIQSTSPA